MNECSRERSRVSASADRTDPHAGRAGQRPRERDDGQRNGVGAGDGQGEVTVFAGGGAADDLGGHGSAARAECAGGGDFAAAAVAGAGQGRAGGGDAHGDGERVGTGGGEYPVLVGVRIGAERVAGAGPVEHVLADAGAERARVKDGDAAGAFDGVEGELDSASGSGDNLFALGVQAQPRHARDLGGRDEPHAGAGGGNEAEVCGRGDARGLTECESQG